MATLSEALTDAAEAQAAGRHGDAAAAFRRAIHVAPKNAKAHNGYGLALFGLGRLGEAESAFHQSLALDPQFADPLINLGLIRARREDFEGAAAHYVRALDVDRQSTKALNNLGTVYASLGRQEEALDCYRTALRLQPRSATMHYNVGCALRMLGRYGEAKESFVTAVALDANEIEALIGLGVIADVEANAAEAVAWYDRALQLDPNAANAHLNRAIALLGNRDLAAGWRDFAWRWNYPPMGRWKRAFPQPTWTGEPVPGAVLVWAEQGIGDEVFYAGMLPDLIARGQWVVFECDPRLVPLFRRALPAITVVPRMTPAVLECTSPDVTHQIPLGDLGPLLRPSVAAIPPRTAYLVPDENKRQAYRERLAGKDAVRAPLIVGISWRAPLADFAAEKSSRLVDWKPILRQKDIRFVDLQYGDSSAERAAVAAALGVAPVHLDGIDLKNDLDETAALIAACDLVISVSNSTVHLAAALGVPTWVLVPKGNGRLWYWFHDSGPSPWYPSVRLFQQDKPGNWQPQIEAAAHALKKLRKG